jgi:hypothetical protein
MEVMQVLSFPSITSQDMAPISIVDNINLYGKKTGPALGIANASGTNSQIHIYPNPTTGQLAVDWYNPIVEKMSLDIYNVLRK